MSDTSPKSLGDSRKVHFLAVSLFGRCPRCDEGHIFQKFLGLKDRCPVCDMDLEPYNQADGPAFFVILIAGALMTPITLWLASAFALPWPVLAALMGALTILVVLAMLRVAKGLLIASQYKTDAHEGRLDQEETP